MAANGLLYEVVLTSKGSIKMKLIFNSILISLLFMGGQVCANEAVDPIVTASLAA